MSKRLKWTERVGETTPANLVAFGDHCRLYTIGMNRPDGSRWLASLALGDATTGLPETAVVCSGWARTLDEAKQIAEGWEQVLRKHEMPQVADDWD